MTDPTAAQLAEQLELVTESLADVQAQLDRDNAGWQLLGSLDENLQGFDQAFRNRQAMRALVAVTADPLIKRGFGLRSAYIWGDGVSISVRDEASTGQDVNAVAQDFLDDPQNQRTFASMDAQIALERHLCTRGEVFLCLPTDPVTGRVRVRLLPGSQITDIVTDPDDEASWWFVRRQWTQTGDAAQRDAYYPILGYRPMARPTSIDGHPVMWDAPVRPVVVNQIGNRGVGDVFAALPWSSGYTRFLGAWAKLMDSLARFSWQMSTRGDKTAQAAARLGSVPPTGWDGTANVGLGVTLGPGEKLEAISKSGATFDAESGRPLAVMVAAALDIPVTTLLGDPGTTGARATAADVTSASWAAFDIRRHLWTSVIQDIIGWVIDAQVLAPSGLLTGTVKRDGNRQVVQLPADDNRTVAVDWPQRDDDTLLDRVKAIQIADQSDKIPPLVLVREYLHALGVDDIDEILEQITDDNGNFIPLDVTDQAVRDKLTRAGGAQV